MNERRRVAIEASTSLPRGPRVQQAEWYRLLRSPATPEATTQRRN
jgi:hypothetical protein